MEASDVVGHVRDGTTHQLDFRSVDWQPRLGIPSAESAKNQRQTWALHTYFPDFSLRSHTFNVKVIGHQGSPPIKPSIHWTVKMTRGNAQQIKVHLKGKTEDFVIFVDSKDAVQQWKKDKSVPLAQVLSGWKVFITHK